MRLVGLFRHGAGLSRPHGAAPGVMFFNATGMSLQLVASDTSPFHDLPDGAQCYVEIGVDLDCVADDVKRPVEEFVRHGRRPKFGPPLHTIDGSPEPQLPGADPALAPLFEVDLEVVEVGDPCKLAGQTYDGDKVEAEISVPMDTARELGRLLYRDVRLVLTPLKPLPPDERIAALRSWIKARGAVSTDDVLKDFIDAGLRPERLPDL